MRKMRNNGFTLVEFSIAIVVIGLILAAIAMSRNLSETSKLNSIANDFESFKIKFSTFKQIYGQYPGDFNNASTIWADCDTVPSNCNGNGNHRVQFDTSGSPLIEGRLVFRHLSLSGMLGETIQVIPTLTSPADTTYNNVVTASDWILGKMTYNSQAKLVATSEFTAYTNAFLTNDSFPWNNNINAVFMSYWSSKPNNTESLGSPLNAQQAFYLDSKFDDGYIDSSGNGAGADSGKLRTVSTIAGVCLNSGLYDILSSPAITSNGCVMGYQLND